MHLSFTGLTALILSILLLCGCTVAAKPPANTPAAPDQASETLTREHTLSVISTLFPPFDFARQIAGGLAQITLLLSPGAESHTYEPTPQDILRIQKCDVFLYIGGESEAWVTKLLSSMDTSHMRVVRLIDCVKPVEEELGQGMEDHSEAQPETPSVVYDEHIWTAPENAILMTKAISQAMIKADPDHADAYQSNTDSYIGQLSKLDQTFEQIAQTAVRHTLVFGDRFPFRYFVDAYGYDYYAAFPGCAEQTEPSAATVAFLIDRVREQNIPVIFYIEFSNEKMADTICEATGAKKLLLHSCHNVSKVDLEGGATYISLMYQNTQNLREAVS